jgi:hypothetical protein
VASRGARAADNQGLPSRLVAIDLRKKVAPTALPARDDIGPTSSGEAERLRARNTDLENENALLRSKVIDLESENAELLHKIEGYSKQFAELRDKFVASKPTPSTADDDLAYPPFLDRNRGAAS